MFPHCRTSSYRTPALMAWTCAFIVAAAACSASDTKLTDDDDDGGGTSTSSAGGSGGGFLAGSGGSGGGVGGGCSEAAKLIYVLSDANNLYSFKPDEKQFTLIGPLQCQTSRSPNSMALDRDAVAWVNYVDSSSGFDSAGSIYKVSTVDASCEAQPTVELPDGFYRVGMGFSTNGPSTTEETLFVTGVNSSGAMGRIDSGSLVPIGSFTGAFANQSAELTGTGDGRLYGFFTSTPVNVAELGKSDASIISDTPLGTVEVPNAWAFSFWGGDFYLYTAQAGNSRVNQYRPSTGTVDTTYMPDVGFRIVGAGVSTCAPLLPPQ